MMMAALVAPAAAQTHAGDARILFIGNSLTYANNLPEMVSDLARQAGRNVHVDHNVSPGRTLAEALADDALIQQIDGGSWTHIVLQPQGHFGNLIMINGQPRVPRETAGFDVAATEFLRRVEAAGAVPVFIAPWVRRGAPEEDRTAIADAIVDIVETGGVPAEILPVGYVFAALGDRITPLISPDDMHPAPAGTYVAALFVLQTVLDIAPDTVALRAQGRPMTTDLTHADAGQSETVVMGDPAVLVELDVETGERLQTAVRDALIGWPAERARLANSEPAPLDVPALGQSTEVLRPAELFGYWSGEARHYPDFLPSPAAMQIYFLDEGAGLEAVVELVFRQPAATRPMRVVNFRSPVVLSGNRLEFRDLNGMAGSTIIYQAVLNEGALDGIATFEGVSQVLTGSGGWQASRD